MKNTDNPSKVFGYLHYIYVLLCLLLLSPACTDVLIPDIESDTVLLISPPENAVIESNTITFQWQEVPEVDNYRFEIAEPSFDNLNTLTVDSFLASAQITLDLPIGAYEWRVQGYNAAFSTSCCEIGRFSVTESAATDTLVPLVASSPENMTFVNQLPVFFAWEANAIYQAYDIQISIASDFSSLVANSTTTLPNFSLALLAETVYFWRIRGVRQAETGPWLVSTFTLDYNPPFQPVPLTPDNNQTINLSTSDPDFTWQTNTDVILSRLDLYNDTLATDLAFTTFTPDFRINLDTVADPPSPGTYFWQISSRDEAGNFSSPSPVQRVIIE